MLVYTRYPGQDLTVFVVQGETSISDWLDALKRYGKEGPTTYELYDLRAVPKALSSDDIRRIISVVRGKRDLRPPDSKTAVVVDDAVHFGTARMYELMSETEGISWETRPFYSVADAADWLGKDVTGLIADTHPSPVREDPAD